MGETFREGSRVVKVTAVLLRVPEKSPFSLTDLICASLQNLCPHPRPTESASSLLQNPQMIHMRHLK